MEKYLEDHSQCCNANTVTIEMKLINYVMSETPTLNSSNESVGNLDWIILDTQFDIRSYMMCAGLLLTLVSCVSHNSKVICEN